MLMILDVLHNKCLLAANLKQTLRDMIPKRQTEEQLEMIYLSKLKLVYMQMTPFSEDIKKMIELSMTNGDAPTLLHRPLSKC